MAGTSNDRKWEWEAHPASGQSSGSPRILANGTVEVATCSIAVNDRALSLKTVLIVEDDFFIRMNAAEVVRDAGLPVLEAANATEALDMLRLHPEVAVLFTDIDMPGGMDGLDLAERVHADSPAVQLMLTSGRAHPTPEEIPDDGVFLAKPYSEADLTRLIRQVASKVRPQS